MEPVAETLPALHFPRDQGSPSLAPPAPVPLTPRHFVAPRGGLFKVSSGPRGISHPLRPSPLHYQLVRQRSRAPTCPNWPPLIKGLGPVPRARKAPRGVLGGPSWLQPRAVPVCTNEFNKSCNNWHCRQQVSSPSTLLLCSCMPPARAVGRECNCVPPPSMSSCSAGSCLLPCKAAEPPEGLGTVLLLPSATLSPLRLSDRGLGAGPEHLHQQDFAHRCPGILQKPPLQSTKSIFQPTTVSPT